MSFALLQYFGSAAIIIVSGIGMARATDTISRAPRMGQLLGGALLVATTPSLPDVVLVFARSVVPQRPRL